MSFDHTWSTLQEAVDKYGITERQLGEWVEEGLVRAETDGKKVLRVNLDDLELQIHKLTGI